MKFYKRFAMPIYKIGATDVGDIIEVGDDLRLVLRDNSETLVQVASVEKGGRRVGWHNDGQPVNYTGTSAQDATASAADDATGDALANALKAAYNLARADVVTVFTNNEPLGTPTATANATTAATTDGTRLALANALRTNMLALAVDLAELQAAHPELVAPIPVAADFAPIGSDDATTQTLLNDLKAEYNIMQTAIQEALDSLETGGWYQPRPEDVIAVSGLHRFACPVEEDAEYGHLHDGPEDGETFDPIVNPLGAPRTSLPQGSVMSEQAAPKRSKASSEEGDEDDEDEPKKAPAKKKTPAKKKVKIRK